LADNFARLEAAFQNEIKINTKEAGKSFMVRTCRELRAADPTLTSGMYWIDPDGQGVGEDPINVYCDMATGRKGNMQFNITGDKTIPCLVRRIYIRSTRQ